MMAAEAQAPTLTLPAEMLAEIVAHAHEELPRECCGLIAGRDGVAQAFYRLRNAAPGIDFYEIDPNDLYRVSKELDRRGWDVMVIYHSHPTSRAYPSATDIELAFWTDAYYLICSLEQPGQPDLRAFTIRDGQVQEAALRSA